MMNATHLDALDKVARAAGGEHGYRSREHLAALSVLADALEEAGDYKHACLARHIVHGFAQGPNSWRRDAEFLIGYMVEHLPKNMNIKAKRDAINGVYPWPPRKGFPYRVWLKVMKEMLIPTLRRQHQGDEWEAGTLFGGRR